MTCGITRALTGISSTVFSSMVSASPVSSAVSSARPGTAAVCALVSGCGALCARGSSFRRIRSPLSGAKRYTLAGFRSKCTSPPEMWFQSSADMMERTTSVFAALFRKITETSRPVISGRTISLCMAPPSRRMKPSGRIPTETGPSGTDSPSATRNTGSPAIHSCPSFSSPSNMLMGGVPRNCATN